MKTYFFIGAGGAVGALLRFTIKAPPAFFPTTDLLLSQSFNILLINLFGCLLLGMLNAIFSKTVRISPNIKLGITAGFVGSFTTFSTFCKESLNLLDAGYISAFFYNITASVLLGITAVYIGHLIGHRVVHPICKSIVSQFSIDYN